MYHKIANFETDMNRFKLQSKPLIECSKLQRDFHFSGALASQDSLDINPNLNTLRLDDDGNSKPIEILYRRYLQLKEAWYEKQPTEFQDVFEVNTYCSEALAYVSKLETMIEGVKTMYREQWYREQYLTMSKHGFHAFLAGTHSIFVVYKFLKFLFYLYCFFIIAMSVWVFLDDNSGFKFGDPTIVFLLFGIWVALKFSELVLNTIFGKNHQQIIRDNIRKQEVPDSALSAHLLTIAQDTKKLRDDIDFFQQQWIKKLGG